MYMKILINFNTQNYNLVEMIKKDELNVFEQKHETNYIGHV